MSEDELKNALLKKALGFASDEVVEEFLPDENGKIVLSKRKVTKKFNPPDINALKLLLEQAELGDDVIASMTDKQLEMERKRLLRALKEKEKKKDENGDL